MSYNGTVDISSSDGHAVLPNSSTLSGGVGTFSVTLTTAGIQTVTAADSVNTALKATSNAITVNPAAATQFVVNTPATVTAGGIFNLTVTAQDTFGNTATAYTGTVGFTTTDPLAPPPGNATLTHGFGTFSAVLEKAGPQTLTATDTTTNSITGTSNIITVNPAAATRLTVTGTPSSVTAGTSVTFTVTALDTFGNTATGYSGTVHFTTTDGQAAPPINTTLANGLGTFNVTLKTASNQTITAADTATAINGTSAAVTVNPGLASHFSYTGPLSTVTAGTAFNLTVTALDSYGNTATGYTGTVHFTSTDNKATLPTDSSLIGGMGGFSVVFKTAGSQMVSATDTVTTSINGTTSPIQVSPGQAAIFVVTGTPSAVTAGTNVNFTVTALDTFGNTATGYTGTVGFTTTDTLATAPANSTLTSGVGVFGVTLKKSGNQSLTATDASTGSINGTSNTITVTAAAATHFSVTGTPNSVTAGTNVNFTVTALDTFGNTATGYTGTVGFTTTDILATAPGNSTLTSGLSVFGLTLKKSGTQTLTATDASNNSVNGTSNTVTVSAAGATHFTVTGTPGSVTAGTNVNFTVTALDTFDNTATGYSGTVGFSTTDPLATAPSNATLTSGVGVFGVTLKKSGNQTLTATDTSTSSINGTSNAITVTPAGATHFTVTGTPSSLTAGTNVNFTVTAQDTFGNTATGYTGTVGFTTTDTLATAPANSTLTGGVGTFTITLKTAGDQTLTATDVSTSSITGTSSTITVIPAGASQFVVAVPNAVTAGSAVSVRVTAEDPFGNIATSYAGTVTFTSSDPAAALPANSALPGGVNTFAATFKTAGTQTLTATDTTTLSMTGNGVITVNPLVSTVATHFSVTAPTSITAGNPLVFTVTALDQSNNIASTYNGTAAFTTSDAQAVPPVDSTLTNGVGTFTFILKTAGTQTVTATDTSTASITGSSGPITVNAAAATHFTVSAPPTAVAGQAFSFTVTALDSFGNTAKGYAGTVAFTTTDPLVPTLPNSTLTNGVGIISATLEKAQTTTITAADTATTSINGTSSAVTVTPAAATHFVITGMPNSISAGLGFALSITAEDQFGNKATTYSGTVHFSSTDSQAVLPSNRTLVNGFRAITFTMKTAGIQTVTASDTVATGITGTSGPIDVTPLSTPSIFVISGTPAATVAGTTFNFTVTALDTYGNTVTAYTGTVHFSSTDTQATLPADTTLTSGVGTFSATLATVGTQTLTADDTVTAGIRGVSPAVTVSPGAPAQFAITGTPGTVAAGSMFNFTVIAEDQFGNVTPSYNGYVAFSSTDFQAVLPTNTPMTNGAGTFSATLATAGAKR